MVIQEPVSVSAHAVARSDPQRLETLIKGVIGF
jgi:hypothetical protein